MARIFEEIKGINPENLGDLIGRYAYPTQEDYIERITRVDQEIQQLKLERTGIRDEMTQWLGGKIIPSRLSFGDYKTAEALRVAVEPEIEEIFHIFNNMGWGPALPTQLYWYKFQPEEIDLGSFDDTFSDQTEERYGVINRRQWVGFYYRVMVPYYEVDENSSTDESMWWLKGTLGELLGAKFPHEELYVDVETPWNRGADFHGWHLYVGIGIPLVGAMEQVPPVAPIIAPVGDPYALYSQIGLPPFN